MTFVIFCVLNFFDAQLHKFDNFFNEWMEPDYSLICLIIIYYYLKMT